MADTISDILKMRNPFENCKNDILYPLIKLNISLLVLNSNISCGFVNLFEKIVR